MVKYEQLTEQERNVMQAIWDRGQGGLPSMLANRVSEATLTTLYQFGLTYCNPANRYVFTGAGRKMMVAQQLAARGLGGDAACADDKEGT